MIGPGLQIRGPDGSVLIFEPFDRGYVLHVVDDSAEINPDFRLEIAEVHEFNGPDPAPEIEFLALILPFHAASGEVPHTIFVSAKGGTIRLGEWPDERLLRRKGEDGPISRRWKVKLRALGSRTPWGASLVLAWDADTDCLQLFDHGRATKNAADLSGMYERLRGRNCDDALKQEELLQDARSWAIAESIRARAQVADVEQLKELVVQGAYEFVQKHRHHNYFELSYDRFASALWEEGAPSLCELVEEGFWQTDSRRAGSMSHPSELAGDSESRVAGLLNQASHQAMETAPETAIDSPFLSEDPKRASWAKFLAQQQRWFDLHLSFGKELASVKGPSDYWDWLLKHAEIVAEAIYRDPHTCRPMTFAPRPPLTYNPDWVEDEPDRSADVEFIKRLHSRMLDQSLTAFVTQERDRDLAVRLVEFWAQHLAAAIGNASQVLEDHVSSWRDRSLREVADYVRRRWPRSTWANNHAPPEVWRKLREDVEGLGKGDYALIWSTAPPTGFRGELLESHYTWCRFPDEGSRARFTALATRAAIALGYGSDDDWYDEIRNADFVRFELTGSGYQKDENGQMTLVSSGPLENVWARSITLMHLLEADSERKKRPVPTSAGAGSQQPILIKPIIAPGGLPSGFAAGEPTLLTSDTASKQIQNLLRDFPELRSALGGSGSAEQKLAELIALVKGHPDGVTGISGGAAKSPEAEIRARAARRQAIINPILEGKGWKPGRLATKAGVGKNSIYEYLDGTRATITDENRKAIAEALGLEPEQLPD